MKFRLGDDAYILSGKHKKQIAKIIGINGNLVKLSEVNMKTHFVKSKENKMASKIEKKEGFLPMCKIAHIENGKPVKTKIVDKVLVSKKTGNAIRGIKNEKWI